MQSPVSSRSQQEQPPRRPPDGARCSVTSWFCRFGVKCRLICSLQNFESGHFFLKFKSETQSRRKPSGLIRHAQTESTRTPKTANDVLTTNSSATPVSGQKPAQGKKSVKKQSRKLQPTALSNDIASVILFKFVFVIERCFCHSRREKGRLENSQHSSDKNVVLGCSKENFYQQFLCTLCQNKYMKQPHKTFATTIDSRQCKKSDIFQFLMQHSFLCQHDNNTKKQKETAMKNTY